jgi:hypothetical protein
VDVVRQVARLRGAPPPRLIAPPGALRVLAAALQQAQRLPRWPKLPADYTAEYLRVAAGSTYLGSNARAVHELGFMPRTVADGIAEVYG